MERLKWEMERSLWTGVLLSGDRRLLWGSEESHGMREEGNESLSPIAMAERPDTASYWVIFTAVQNHKQIYSIDLLNNLT